MHFAEACCKAEDFLNSLGDLSVARRCVLEAEGVGFEPTEAFTSLVFKTRAINHSTTPPSASPRDVDRQACLVVGGDSSDTLGSAYGAEPVQLGRTHPPTGDASSVRRT